MACLQMNVLDKVTNIIILNALRKKVEEKGNWPYDLAIIL